MKSHTRLNSQHHLDNVRYKKLVSRLSHQLYHNFEQLRERERNENVFFVFDFVKCDSFRMLSRVEHLSLYRTGPTDVKFIFMIKLMTTKCQFSVTKNPINSARKISFI